MHLFDTDSLTHWSRGNARILRHIAEVEDTDLGTTIISKIEMLRSRFDQLVKASSHAEFLRAQDLLNETEVFLAELPIMPLSGAALTEFDRLLAIKGLKKIGRSDLLIASITLAHQATLVTRNLRHFRRIPDLRVVNWVD
jgi:tRNA(fMet)-specific endonuclease VapC